MAISSRLPHRVSRRRTAFRTGLTAAALTLATAVFGLLVNPTAAHAAEPPTTGPVFNNPHGTVAEQSAIFTRLVELIDGAPAGSTIRMSVYYAQEVEIPNALVAAKQRGVAVQVIMDEKMVGYPAALAVLRNGLGTDLSASSWFLTCGANRGCIANRPGGGSISHNKFYLFTNTLGVPNVIVQSSANLHRGRDGGRGWNDALIVTGNPALFASYVGYFTDLSNRRTNNDYYHTGRVPLQAGAAKVFYYPRAAAAGTDPYNNPGQDTIMTILNNTECHGNTTVGTTVDHRTMINVTMSAFELEYVAARLVALDAAGCYIRVTMTHNPGSARSTAVLATLLRRTSSAYKGIEVDYYCKNNDPVWIHAKYMTIAGKYYGKINREIVWTGSYNFSGYSLRGSDETILQLENGTVYDRYNQHFGSVAAQATHHPANGAGIAC